MHNLCGKMPLKESLLSWLEGVEDKICRNRLGTHELESLVILLGEMLPQAHERVVDICTMLTERSYYQSCFILKGGIVQLVHWQVSGIMPTQKCLGLVVGLDAISLKRSVVNRARFVASGGILALCYLDLTCRDSLEFWQTNPGKAIHFSASVTKLASAKELKRCLSRMHSARRHLQAKASDSLIVSQLDLDCTSGGVAQAPSNVEKLIVILGEEWTDVCMNTLQRLYSDRHLTNVD